METLWLWGEFSFVLMFQNVELFHFGISGFILNVTYFRCLFMSNTSRIALVPVMDFACVKMSSYSILEFSGFILNVTYFSCLFMSKWILIPTVKNIRILAPSLCSSKYRLTLIIRPT